VVQVRPATLGGLSSLEGALLLAADARIASEEEQPVAASQHLGDQER
jgi:hypothetical protein